MWKKKKVEPVEFIDFDKIDDLPFEGEEDPELTKKGAITLDLSSLVNISDAHGLEINGKGILSFYTEEDLDVKDLLDLEDF
jgi:hypothetical protein